MNTQQPTMERLIFFDTETTGLSAESGDRLVEMGAVECVARQLTGNTFQTYLNPQRANSEGAYRVHQLSDEFLAQQPPFSKQAESFLAFIGNDTLVIHNADFDMGFINAELKRIKKPPLTNPVVDTTKLARGAVQGLGKYSLDALCDHFRIDRTHRKAHGALLDAELLAEVYLRMTRTQGGFNLDSFEHLNYRQRLTAVRDSDGRVPILPVELTDTQRLAHHEWVRQMNAPIWPI